VSNKIAKTIIALSRPANESPVVTKKMTEQEGRAETARLIRQIGDNLGVDWDAEPEFIVVRNPKFPGRRSAR